MSEELSNGEGQDFKASEEVRLYPMGYDPEKNPKPGEESTLYLTPELSTAEWQKSIKAIELIKAQGIDGSKTLDEALEILTSKMDSGESYAASKIK